MMDTSTQAFLITAAFKLFQLVLILGFIGFVLGVAATTYMGLKTIFGRLKPKK